MSFFDDLVNTLNPVNLATGFVKGVAGMATEPFKLGADVVAHIAPAGFHSLVGIGDYALGNKKGFVEEAKKAQDNLDQSDFVKGGFKPISDAADASKGKNFFEALTDTGKGTLQAGSYLANKYVLPYGGLAVGAPGVAALEGAGAKVAGGAALGAGFGAASGALTPASEGDFNAGDIAKSSFLGSLAGGATGGALVGTHEAGKYVAGHPEVLTAQHGSVGLNEPLKPTLTPGPAAPIKEAFARADELKPVESKLEQVIRSNKKQATRLQVEIGRFERSGLQEALKNGGVDSLPDFSPEGLGGGVPTSKAGVKIGPQDTARFMSNLVDSGSAKIKNLKGMVATRENKLGPLFDELATLSDQLESVKGTRLAYRGEANAARRQGTAEITGGGVFDKIKSFPEEIKNHFSGWVNNRGAADLEAVKTKQDFKALDAEGVDAFHKVQSGETQGDYGKLQEYFGNKFEQLKTAGIKFGQQKDYLPQLWDNKPEEIAQVFGKKLSEAPQFSLRKVIDSYQEGIDAGLKPRFDKVSDLVGWYEQKANRALADKAFLDGLKESGRLLPADKAPIGWKALSPDLVPGPILKAEPALAKVINNHLEQAQFGGLAKAAKGIGRIKNVVLGFGIPKTGINAHGVNIFVRSVLADKNPIGRAMTTGDWLVRPGEAAKFFDTHFDAAVELRKAGLTVTSEEHAFARQAQEVSGNIVKRAGAKLGDWQQTLFEDPLFGKILPAAKLRYAIGLAKDLESKGMEHELALKTAAKAGNETFGGINIEEVARSKDFQNFLRTFALAPDWLETQFRLGKDIAKSVTTQATNPEFKGQRTFARNLILGYVAANVMNKAFSGHWMFENGTGGQFQLDTGTKDSKDRERYIPLFGGAVDFVRVPIEAAVPFFQSGDLSAFGSAARSRLSTPVAAAVSLATNTDNFGSPIFGKDKYGKTLTPMQNLAGAANLATSAVAPTPVQMLSNTLQGKSSVEQAVAGGLELPVRYRKVSSGSGSSTKTRAKKPKKIKASSRKAKSIKRAKNAKAPRIKAVKIKTAKIKKG